MDKPQNGIPLFREFEGKPNELNDEGVRDLLTRTLTQTFKKANDHAEIKDRVQKPDSNNIILNLFNMTAAGITLSMENLADSEEKVILVALANMNNALIARNRNITALLEARNASMKNSESILIDAAIELQEMIGQNHIDPKYQTLNMFLGLNVSNDITGIVHFGSQSRAKVEDGYKKGAIRKSLEEEASKAKAVSNVTRSLPKKLTDNVATVYDAKYQILNKISDHLNNVGRDGTNLTVKTQNGDTFVLKLVNPRKNKTA